MKISFLHIALLLFAGLILGIDLHAQDTNNKAGYDKRKLDPVEVDFLFGYYGQDGANSAVTGGRGTEKLDYFSPLILVNIPVDTNKNITIDAGVDVYTSASTDNIDYNMSSASYKDARTHARLGYSQDIGNIGLNAGVSGSFSIESDYLSRGISFSLLQSLNDENTFIGLTGNFYFDVIGWGWLNPDHRKNVAIIYPVELRDTAWFSDGRRNTYAFAFSWTQNITTRLNMGLFADFTLQQGLLSTPFHRVYFQETNWPAVEKLPSVRRKFPIGIRINYFPLNFMIIRTYYRYYADSWGIRAHTASVELPFKVTPFFSIYPSYRYHQQSSSYYFKPYKEHSINDEYYTSDYDISGLTSHEVGGGIRIAPPMGVFRMKMGKKGKRGMLRQIDLRYVYYMRSDGMKAHSASLGIYFTGY